MPHWFCHCHSHRARLPGLCLALTLSEFLSHSLLPRTCYWHHPEAMACYDHPRDHYVSPERLGCFFSVSRSLFRKLVSFLTFDNKIRHVSPFFRSISPCPTSKREWKKAHLRCSRAISRSRGPTGGREREWCLTCPHRWAGGGASFVIGRDFFREGPRIGTMVKRCYLGVPFLFCALTSS